MPSLQQECKLKENNNIFKNHNFKFEFFEQHQLKTHNLDHIYMQGFIEDKTGKGRFNIKLKFFSLKSPQV